MRELLGQYLAELKEDFAVYVKPYIAKAKKKFTREKLKKDASFLHYLPYRTYSPQNGLFTNNMTHGFILRVSHFIGVDIRAKEVLKGIISNDLPCGYTVQIINYASPRIGNLLDYWHNSGSSGAIFSKVSARRREFFEEGSWQSILGNRKSLLVRDYELYICISVKKTFAIGEKGKEFHQLFSLKEKIIEGLKGINCWVHQLSGHELCGFLKEIINPEESIYKNNFSKPHADLREGLASPHNC